MKIIFCFLLLFPITLFAAEDFYPFTSLAQQDQFRSLTMNLRCLVCQNQNLAESNAPLAADLRAQIYQQVSQGKSDQVIVNYLVARYGNFILYRPPLDLATAVLWIGPFLFLLIGVGFVILNVVPFETRPSRLALRDLPFETRFALLRANGHR